MKKIIILMLFIPFINVYANVETYERTDDNLKVHESIEVNSYNKQEILKTPSVDETKKVYDFADLIDEQNEIYLFNKTNEFIKNYNMDLVLVTIDDNWTTARKYADNFYDYNYFGIGKTFDGVLLLIDMDTREMYISTTGKAILMYNDYRIENVLDEMYNYIQNGNYFETFVRGIDKLEYFQKKGIPEGNKNSYIDKNGDYVYKAVKTFPLFMFLFISSITATIVLVIFISKNKLVRKAHDAKEYMEKDNARVLKVQDRFITSHTSRVRINTDSSSGSSFGGGSSSTHRSSSGRSHGGGGRSF